MAFGSPAPGVIPDRNAACLRGLVWACRVLAEDVELARAVGDVGETCFRKVPGHGAFAPTVGNACIDTLAAMTGLEPAAQLGRLKQRVKYPVARGRAEQALGRAATRASLEPEDLEELAVPACGLTETGRGRIPVGSHVAVISVRGTTDVELTWTEPGGASRKSAPAAARRSHPDQVKGLARQVREIEKLLPVQRDRIERLLMADRHWDLATWRARYLDHPLLATLTRRLIWHFTDGARAEAAISHDGRLVDATGCPLDWLSDRAAVRLWHPLGAAPEVVSAWRRSLQDHGIQQPFKQAHREIYLLTDAERETATDSNRFAGHVLRQHQFAALCRERGWRYQVQGDWDSHNVPTLPLPAWAPSGRVLGGAGLADRGRHRPVGGPSAPGHRPGAVRHAVGRAAKRCRRSRLACSPRSCGDVDLFVGVRASATTPPGRTAASAASRRTGSATPSATSATTAATRRELLERRSCPGSRSPSAASSRAASSGCAARCARTGSTWAAATS